MNPSTPTTQANTGDGTILPPPAAATSPTAQSDQLQAANLPNTQLPPATSSILPTTSTPSFSFVAPDMPTVQTVDPSQYTDMTKLSAAEQANEAALMNSQSSLEKGVFGQYQQAVASQGSALDQYNQLSQQMNLPVYQQQVNTIKGLLSRLSDDIDTRAQGTFMNQAQRDQLEASEGKTLNNQLAPLAQAQTDAESNISKMMGFTAQDNQTQLDPIKTYLASLDSAFGRQLTGLDSSNSGASQALQSRLDAEEKSREDAAAAQQAAWQHQFQDQQLALQSEANALSTKYNSIMASAMQPAQAAPAAPSSALSQQQVNAALWLSQNGGPGSVSNYKSAPASPSYLGTIGSLANRAGSLASSLFGM